VRRALTPLAALAARRDTAIWMARHLNKRGGKVAIYRGGGAIGLVGLCRSAWLVGCDPTVAGQCVLAQVKNNLAAPQCSLAYRVVARDDGPPQLSWLGTSPWTADHLVAGSSRGLARIQARLFLQQALQNGPRLTHELWAEGEKQGLKARTLQRARHDLSIRRVRVFEGGVQKNYWLLPGQELPAAVADADDPFSLEPWLAPLREKYPEATPIDED
jgi:hypothetical protein